MWTQFVDMHSGGGLKEPPYAYIYIEAPEKEAAIIFYNRFDHSPHRVTCTCCGNDYSLTESETLEQATAYERNCQWVNDEIGYVEQQDPRKTYSKYTPLDEYLKKPTVLVIRAEEIKPDECAGDIPQQGYVWVD